MYSHNGAARYRGCSFRRYGLERDLELIQVQTTGARHVLPTRIARLLDACRSFLQAECHAQTLSERLGYDSGQLPAIMSLLNDFVDTKLLISDHDIISWYDTLPLDCANCTITSLGIMTSGRPKCLERCLNSYILNLLQYGHDVTVRVCDDSADMAVAEQNERVCQRVSTNTNVRIIHFGLRQRADLISWLVAQGLKPDLVHFALSSAESIGITTGANRNALLLSTIGELVLTVDDDTICSATVSSPETRSLALTSAYNPMEFTFYSDYESLTHSISIEQPDILTAHSKALGRTLRDFIVHFSGFLDFNRTEVGNDFMTALQSGRGSILLTQTGIAGDCAFGSPSGYLTACGPTQKRLFDSADVYNTACSTRQVIGIVDNWTLTDSMFLMTYAVGLDNRTGLVPFFPMFRNQDSVFSRSVRKCFAHSLTCHIPYAVLHSPPSCKSFELDAVWKDADRFDMSDLIILCINSCSFAFPFEHDALLRSLGRYLVELGSANTRDFCDFLRQLRLSAISYQLRLLDGLVTTNRNAPSYWVRDVTRRMKVLKELVTGGIDIITPQDVAKARPAEPLLLAQKFLRNYGELLESWPNFVNIAQKYVESALEEV